jgi:hypothetical protein
MSVLKSRQRLHLCQLRLLTSYLINNSQFPNSYYPGMCGCVILESKKFLPTKHHLGSKDRPTKPKLTTIDPSRIFCDSVCTFATSSLRRGVTLASLSGERSLCQKLLHMIVNMISYKLANRIICLKMMTRE